MEGGRGSGMCDEMLSRMTADGIPHSFLEIWVGYVFTGTVTASPFQHLIFFFFCQYMRIRAHCKFMLDFFVTT